MFFKKDKPLCVIDQPSAYVMAVHDEVFSIELSIRAMSTNVEPIGNANRENQSSRTQACSSLRSRQNQPDKSAQLRTGGTHSDQCDLRERCETPSSMARTRRLDDKPSQLLPGVSRKKWRRSLSGGSEQPTTGPRPSRNRSSRTTPHEQRTQGKANSGAQQLKCSEKGQRRRETRCEESRNTSDCGQRGVAELQRGHQT
jgi:hypothetical protein